MLIIKNMSLVLLVNLFTNNIYSQKHLNLSSNKYICNIVYRKTNNTSWEKLSYFQDILITYHDNNSYRIKSFDYLTDLIYKRGKLENIGDWDEAMFEPSKYIKSGEKDGLIYNQYEGVLNFNTRNGPVFITTKTSFIFKNGVPYGLEIGTKGSPFLYLLKFNR